MVIEEYNSCIKKEDEAGMISLLRRISNEDRKQLVPVIKRLAKEYSHFGSLGGGRFGQVKGTEKQSQLMQMSAFVCYNKADYERSPFAIWQLEKEKLNKVIDWYCPSWFSEFVNKQAGLDYIPYYISYEWIMELTGKGYLRPSPELLAKLLPDTVFERDTTGENCFFKPENLLRWEVTLAEHIWYLFEFDSNLHYSDRFIQFAEGASKETSTWVAVFKQMIAEGRIARDRVLKEALLASNRNFNKVLSGWFAQLFEGLEPTTDELLLLQHELFSVLGAPHSKPVGVALKAIRDILGESEFSAERFMDSVPILLASDTKAVVMASLTILEKLAQKNSEFRGRVALMVCPCFIHPTEDIQAKAARLIAKTGDPGNVALRTEIAVLVPEMLTTTRLVLSGYIEMEAGNADAAGIASGGREPENGAPVVSPETELTPIPFPANIDDLVFLASQAFDNNAPWHIDLLAAALVRWGQDLKEADIARFEPAFQRALQLDTRNYISTIGHLDVLLANFFIDVGNWLIRRFPKGRERVAAIYEKYDEKRSVDRRTSYLEAPSIGFYTIACEDSSRLAFYQPYKQLLLAALDRLKSGSGLPLLSTPTHEPCWIRADVLIDRLRLYQAAGKEPDATDLQVALSRCSFVQRAAAIDRVRGELSGEFRELILYLLEDGKDHGDGKGDLDRKDDRDGKDPGGPFEHRPAWVVAALTKKNKCEATVFDALSYRKNSLRNYTGQLTWKSAYETQMENQYDHQAGKSVQVPVTRNRFSVIREYDKAGQPLLKRLVSSLMAGKKAEPPMLYESLEFRLNYISSQGNDIQRILSLIPHNPEPLLADTINCCLHHSKFWEEGQRKLAIGVVQHLYRVWSAPGEMATLFLGSCMLNADKTVITTAGEIWLRAVTLGQVDNAALGMVIGIHERAAYAPLRRFTDLVHQQLFRASEVHNRELQVLIEHILEMLPDEPITHLKRLLELFKELIAVNQGSIRRQGVVERLRVWEGNAGLKKVIGGMR